MMTKNSSNNNNNKEVAAEVQDDVPLPGFRFHPTDQELLGFYLRRKVENRGMSIELIKHVDIYKYDPWDLPCSGSCNVGDKEWYFYCKRGRKYKNSTRPNRVTASGFWKATGIDRPVYNNNTTITTTTTATTGGGVIGLKKSLVFYRGSAGKGTKTDWMMHEFRLPQYHNINMNHHQEAEVWTLCRIIKRNNNNNIATHNNNKYSMQPKPCSSSSSNLESNNQLQTEAPLISFRDPLPKHEHKKKKKKKHYHDQDLMKTTTTTTPTVLDNMESTTTTTATNQNLNDYYYYNCINNNNNNNNTKYENWDALSSVYMESCFASDILADQYHHHHHHPNFLT